MWLLSFYVAARAGGFKAQAAVINLTEWLECQRQFLSSPFSNIFDRLFITWLREINSHQGSGDYLSGMPEYKRGNMSVNSIRLLTYVIGKKYIYFFYILMFRRIATKKQSKCSGVPIFFVTTDILCLTQCASKPYCKHVLMSCSRTNWASDAKQTSHKKESVFYLNAAPQAELPRSGSSFTFFPRINKEQNGDIDCWKLRGVAGGLWMGTSCLARALHVK